MIWNEHSRLKEKHSLLSPSQCGWLNYDDEKVSNRYLNSYAPAIGTLTHSFAEEHIQYKIKLTKYKKDEALLNLLKQGIPEESIDINYIYPNVQAYVNDAIKYDMTPEVILYFSDFCFGTADAISFKDSLLRIHDLKTGKSKPHMEQLLIYAALFCLEYGYDPNDISFELRIYQNSEVTGFNPTAEDINPIISKIIYFDNLLNQVKGGTQHV